LGKRYDAVVGGGSVAGLAFAAEAAKRGISVLVAEEHEEVGEPEKCDGLVSLRGLRRYGFPPEKGVIQNHITSGVIHSPSGREVALNASGLEVVVLDRSAYDKQLAERAESWGAEIRTGSRAVVEKETRSGVDVKVGDRLVESRYYVDATGPSSLHRAGILSAAKYEIEADWVREGAVEIFVDVQKYPGFFAWVIPYGQGLAKVGVAGHRMNAFAALDSFLEARPHRRLRRVAASIYVGGPVDRFVIGNTVKVGESAGQVKPTTAGGIMTSVAGAVIAASWLSDSILLGDPAKLASYQPDWESRFLKEMKNMLRLRSVFEKLSNADIESVVSVLSSPRLLSKLSRSDFDFHASAFLGALGVPGLLRVARVVASAEAKSLLTGG
jgi:geranylgeranyl reductase family protein